MSGCARVNRLQSLLADYERVLASIPACLMGLLMPYKQRVENALRPGLTTHSWLAVGINDCESVTRFVLGYCLLQNCGLNRLNKTRMRVIAALPSSLLKSAPFSPSFLSSPFLASHHIPRFWFPHSRFLSPPHFPLSFPVFPFPHSLSSLSLLPFPTQIPPRLIYFSFRGWDGIGMACSRFCNET